MTDARATSGTVVVTGASKGIGRAVCAELMKRGYRVAGLSRSGESDADHNLVCDVTDEESVRAAMSAAAQSGPLAGLVANAGVHLSSPSDRLATSEYEQVMALNATAVMVCAREIHPYLKRSGNGLIVNMGSFFDRMGVPYNLAYCVSKAAVAAMTRCLGVEWAKDNIRVVNVAPGYVETELNTDFLARDGIREWMKQRVPVQGRPGRPDEVARLVGALFDEDIPYLTAETIYMDGGHGVNH
jgi:NAD(P)-dependent dehydrogenase (short-subunit alcohol dehydrogenase family)